MAVHNRAFECMIAMLTSVGCGSIRDDDGDGGAIDSVGSGETSGPDSVGSLDGLDEDGISGDAEDDAADEDDDADDGDGADEGDEGDEPECEEIPPQPPEGLAGTLCACEGLSFPGAFQAVAGADGTPARVGINGPTQFDGAAEIQGDAIFYAGLKANAAFEVDANASTVGDVEIAGAAHVGGDFDIGGDLLGYGFLDVDGKLGIAGVQTLWGLGLVGSYGPYVAPERPCDCDPAHLIDVVGKVAQAKNANDNGTIGLPNNLAGLGYAEVNLPSGSYYVESLDVLGVLVLNIKGQVELHVGSSVEFIGADFLNIDPGATLSLYVSGSVETIGHVVSGDPDNAGAFTLYVGGSGSTHLNTGNQLFFGSIYAPTTDFEMTGNTYVEGSMFVKSLYTPGLFRIGGGLWSEGEPGTECPPPVADDGGDDAGDGADDGPSTEDDGADGSSGDDGACGPDGIDCPVE